MSWTRGAAGRTARRATASNRSASRATSAEGIGMRGDTQYSSADPARAFHPPGWASSGGGPNLHAGEARRNITTCTSCHREDDCPQSAHPARSRARRMRRRHPAGWQGQRALQAPLDQRRSPDVPCAATSRRTSWAAAWAAYFVASRRHRRSGRVHSGTRQKRHRPHCRWFRWLSLLRTRQRGHRPRQGWIRLGCVCAGATSRRTSWAATGRLTCSEPAAPPVRSGPLRNKTKETPSPSSRWF